MKWSHAAIATAIVFILPLPITALYKLGNQSIGPVVLGYSLFAGGVVAFCWIRAAWKNVNAFVAILVFVPLGILEIVLLLNLFIAITAMMGEMNYQLM